MKKKPKRIQIKVEIRKICCGHEHSLLLSRDGDIYCFGSNEYNQLGLITDKENQLSPIKLNHSEKFTEIFSHYYHHISATLSQNGSFCLGLLRRERNYQGTER